MVTRTEVTANPGVVAITKASNRYLQFTLTAGGPIPIFTFSSSARPEPLYEAPDFLGHPKTKYVWEHLKNPSDARTMERLELAKLYFTNAKYTFKVEICEANGTVSSTVLEIRYTGAPTDQEAPEGFFLIVS